MGITRGVSFFVDKVKRHGLTGHHDHFRYSQKTKVDQLDQPG